MTDKGEATTIPDVKEQTAKADPTAGGFTIGLAANDPDSDETRFLLTPEVCGMLISSGLGVCMESEGGSSISYTDDNYAEYGVEITDRDKVLKCDFVLSFAPLKADDIWKMNKGARMMCIFSSNLFRPDILEAVTGNQICVICLDRIISHNGVPVFADIIDEVDGTTSIWYAQEAFSFLGGGKGMLLGGVPGVNPCEVLVIGEGKRVMHACRAALSVGAMVTLLDNDISSLELARETCGDRLNTAFILPRTLTNKVKSADVILLDSCTNDFQFPTNLKGVVKKDAFVLDFNVSSPSLSTPRTVTQGLASCLLNFFNEVQQKGGFANELATTPGVRAGILAYQGKITNKLVASVSGRECIDLEIMLERAN